MGVTTAVFQELGKIPCLIDKLIKCVRGLIKGCLRILRYVESRPKASLAFEFLNEFMVFSTSSSLISSILKTGLSISIGMLTILLTVQFCANSSTVLAIMSSSLVMISFNFSSRAGAQCWVPFPINLLRFFQINFPSPFALLFLLLYRNLLWLSLCSLLLHFWGMYSDTSHF